MTAPTTPNLERPANANAPIPGTPAATDPAGTPPATTGTPIVSDAPTAPGPTVTSASTAASTTTGSPTAGQLLAELRTTNAAVRRKDWMSADISGSGASLDLLGGGTDPLSSLSNAGLGWFTPFVSFLADPLTQLSGNPGPVASGAQSLDSTGRDLTDIADTYRRSTAEETTGWSGEAASEYRQAGAEHADGIAALGEAGSAMGGAIAGAGEVVAQVVDIVTRLVTEAVGKIVPIMSQAVAAAPATFGQSIAAAIPQCVQIAVDCGGQILGKLAALLTSGQNLMKLVEGALAVVQLVQQVLSKISQQSSSDTPPKTTAEPKEQQQ